MTRTPSHSGKLPGSAWRGGLSFAATVVCVGAASAQSATFSIVPSVSISETATDNRDLANGDKRKADLISSISPGVVLTARRGAVQGTLSYSLNGLVHARDSSENQIQHQLQASGQATGMDGRVGVNAMASASMQTISAYGTQSADPALNGGNQTQTFSYSISPYLAGRLLGDTSYRVQSAYSQTRTGNDGIGNTASLSSSAGLGGRWSVVGWSLDGVRQISETGDRPRSHTGSVIGGLSYAPDVEWLFKARVGGETNDILTGQSERSTTWGAGVTWLPGPRTSLRADYDHRYFGRSYALAVSHRTARTVWTLSDSRNVNIGGSQGRAVVSLYDLMFAQLASAVPDPAQRDLAVRSYLQANGLDAGTQVIVGGFLNSAPTVQRQQALSVLYSGLRSTTVFSMTRTASTAVGNSDAGSQSRLAPSQTGVNVSWSHRLSPEASLVVSASQQHTSGNGIQSGNDLRTITATWSSRLGPYTNVSLGLRHSQFDSDTNPYTESAVLGSVRMQF